MTECRTTQQSQTRVSDAGLIYLKGFHRLKRLDLDGAAITDSGLEHRKGLSDLKWLVLARTGVPDAAVNDLEKALPNCKIIR
jgi:hypothetical protein